MSCAICHEPLTIPNQDGDEGPSTLLDDVELACGDHYHWQCILDHNSSKCAACGTDGLGRDGKFLATVRNEGGVTEDFDLGAELAELQFLAEHPDIERAETFLTLVEQGDADAAEELLSGPDAVNVNATKRNSAQTALHLAAYNNDAEAVEMLLRHGADKNARDDSGQTPLECALEVKAEAAAALLVS
ncbi:ankyrin [Auricularia subglabra TFB-10046 SS5]|nr:ankyrin [Auricularia subglabra TFB-10046 SS5]